MRELVPPYRTQHVAANEAAIEAGANAAPVLAAAGVARGGRSVTRRLMQGSEAIAEAAIAAGCRFFTGYPMLPFTELLENMARKLPAAGGVCINAASELEAVNMTIGAAATGARAATGSCGQGLALMQEGIAELALNELPAVIFNMARGQQDYFQATRGGGWGDYRTITLAPRDVPEAVEHTQLLFDLADRYRTPGHPLRRLRHRPRLGRHRGRADRVPPHAAEGLGARRLHDRHRSGAADLDLGVGQAQHPRARSECVLDQHRRQVRRDRRRRGPLRVQPGRRRRGPPRVVRHDQRLRRSRRRRPTRRRCARRLVSSHHALAVRRRRARRGDPRLRPGARLRAQRRADDRRRAYVRARPLGGALDRWCVAGQLGHAPGRPARRRGPPPPRPRRGRRPEGAR